MQKLSKTFAERKLTALCFSPDRKYCAVAFKDNSSFSIYELPGKEPYLIDTWKHVADAREQTQTISSLDWSVCNKILSCSFDRSMFVFNFPISATSKELVYSAQSKLSVMHGVWSPNGKKFAIGTSCKKLFVAKYDADMKMWVTLWLRIKEDVAFQSTVNVVRFHSSGRVVAAGSTDFSFKLVTAFVDYRVEGDKEVPCVEVEDYTYKGLFDKVTTRGEVLINMSNTQGWINDIAFGLNGQQEILIALHSNQLFLKKMEEEKNKTQPDFVIVWKDLPFLSIRYLNKDTVIAAGFDNRIAVFKRKDQSFEFSKYLDKSLLDAASVTDNTSLVSSRLNMFEKSGLKGLSKTASTKAPQITPHSNVPQLIPFDATTVCSWDVTGKILFWKEQ